MLAKRDLTLSSVATEVSAGFEELAETDWLVPFHFFLRVPLHLVSAFVFMAIPHKKNTLIESQATNSWMGSCSHSERVADTKGFAEEIRKRNSEPVSCEQFLWQARHSVCRSEH